MAPNSVSRPVLATSTFAVPLRTEAPRNTQFVRFVIGASAATRPGRFSTGKDSPVMLASLTRKSDARSEEHTSELQSLMRISYAVFCLKKKKNTTHTAKHRIN